MELWKAISYVTSPLTLVAFLAAVVAWVYVTQLKRIESLIGRAPDKDRKVLIEGVFDVLRVNPEKLGQEQRYELALQLIKGRSLKLKLAFAGFLVVAIGLSGLSVFAFYNQRPEESLKAMLTGERKDEALVALRKHKIYRVDDSALPDALSNLTRLEQGELKLNPIERTERLRAKIQQVPSVVELRRRAEKTEAPFEKLGMKLTAGVPKIGPDQPGRFYVNVPIGAEWAWKRLRVVNPGTGEELRLVARPAIDDQIRDVDLHLNYQQARKLFASDMPTRTAEVWVQVLSPGPLWDPSCEPARTPVEKKRQRSQQCDPAEAPDFNALLRSKG